MAYNIPTNYQQIYYPQQPYQAPQQNNGIIWVQGEAGAKSYLIAPNTTVQLWDSETQTIYLKSADASGMPTMKILDYTIRDSQNHTTAPIVTDEEPLYVTKDEFDTLRDEINDLKTKMDEKKYRR